MAKERRRSMKLSELREQAVEALDQTPYIDVETDTGEVFRVWHPLLVDDETQTRIDRFNAGEDLDKDDDGKIVWPARVKGKLAESAAARSARAVLGPEVHKAFLKAGGHSNDIQLAWNEMVRQHEESEDMLGVLTSITEEDPK
jgi:hypothetical protein